MTKKDLANLYFKKTKISSKVESFQEEIRKKSKDVVELETQLKTIENDLLEKELPNYIIKLPILKRILEKNLQKQQVENILQSVMKSSDSIVEFSEKPGEDTIMEVWTCSCEGRMNVCYSEDEDKPRCPIESKGVCDGIKMHAIFIKRNTK